MEKYKVMDDDAHKNFSNQYCPRFGEIAVNLEFITEDQLIKALVEQIEDDFNNSPRRLIGNILFENGWITNEQVDIVLIILFKEYV
jgi:hypothetical protein